jgi:6-phosphogluconolactonase
MATLRSHQLPTPEALAERAAADLIGLLLRRADLSRNFGIALSGGRIAKTFYDALVRLSKGRQPFDSVHFFWADERCVPPSDPENNYVTAREHLFQPLAIPEENIHRIRGEIDLAFAVREAEAELCRLMPLSAAGQPVLDLVILGMGEDGHVASLFPAEDARLVEDDRVYRHVMAAKPPPSRITLGYQPILAAREVWALISGSGKAAAFARLQQGDQALPISRVAARRAAMTVYHDL